MAELAPVPRARPFSLRSTRLLAPALLALTLACQAKLETPPGAAITCGSTSDCPSGYRCEESFCISQTGNQPPRALVSGTARGVVTVPLTVTVLDSELDDVSVAGEFAVQEAGGGWGAWHAAALSGATGLSTHRDANVHALVWNAVGDAGAGTGLGTRASQADPDAPASTTVLLAARVKLRLTPTDAKGAAGAPVESEPFLVGDSPAHATFPAALGRLGGIAVLAPRVADVESDAVDLVVQFRGAPGQTWRRAAVVVGDTQGLGSAPAPGVDHAIAWDTAAAADDANPAAPQGLGHSNHPAAQLRLGTHMVVGGVDVYGLWSDPVPADVVNQTGPRVIALEARRGVLTRGRSPIAIHYQVADEEADPVDTRVTYSTDGGVTFTPCPEYPSPESEGLLALATSPVAAGGIWHTFVWDAGSGLELPSSVIVQVEAANRLGDSPGDPLAGRTGSAQVILPDTLQTTASIVGSAFEQHDFPLDAWGSDVLLLDLDGDGVLDLVAGSRGTRNRVTVQLGVAGATALGVASFGAPTVHDLGAAPASIIQQDVRIEYVDVEGDGKKDLVFHAEHFAGWLPGLGNGAFGAVKTFSAATDLAGGLCLGDFDEDGRQDVALTYGVETIDPIVGLQVQLGTGPGTFGPATRLPFGAGSYVIRCAPGDLDADGHLDLVVSQWGRTRVLVGDGKGGFTEAALLRHTFGPAGYAVSDLDGDGVDDLAIAEFALPLVDVWRGRPRAAFSSFMEVYSSSGDFPSSVAVLDADGDGRTDLVTDQDVLRMTHEPGVFATGAAFGKVGLRVRTGTAPNGVAFFAVPATATATLRVYNRLPQTAWPSQGAGADYRADANPYVRWLTTDDLDLDGRPDLSALGSFTLDALGGSGRLTSPDGGFSPAATYADPYYPGALAWADLDGDGITDLVQNGATALTAVLRGATPDFARTNFHPELRYEDGHLDESHLRLVSNGVLVADLDGDGDAEIATTRVGYSGATAVDKRLVVLARSGGALTPVADVSDGALAGIAYPPPRRLAAGDLDGDGLLDLVVSSAEVPGTPPASELQLRIYRQAPAGTFTRTNAITLPAGEQGARDLLLADLDDDGILDLAAAGNQSLHLYRGLGANGRGDRTFAGPVTIPLTSGVMQLRAVDLDGDGHLDLAAATASGLIHVLRGGASQGLATGLFTAQPSLSTTGAYSLAADDLNGDGYEDLAAGTSTGTVVFLTEPQRMFAWRTRSLTAKPGVPGTLRAPGYAPPATADAFGATPAPALLGHHPLHAGLEAFSRRVREGVGRGKGLVPLTQAWAVTGRVRLTRELWPPGASVARVAVGVRDGLGAAGTPWVEVPLPVAAARAGTNWATADVVVVRETLDWKRASELPADPASGAPGAAGHLPAVTGQDGALHDLVVPRHVTTLVPRDADGDLATGAGARFVVDTTTSPPVIRVLTEELGTFRAYVRF